MNNVIFRSTYSHTIANECECEWKGKKEVYYEPFDDDDDNGNRDGGDDDNNEDVDDDDELSLMYEWVRAFFFIRIRFDYSRLSQVK